MFKSLIYKVKYNKYFYNIYYYVGMVIVSMIKIFVKPDSKLIVFTSFGGKRFDDSPFFIYKQLLKDKRFENYKFIWAFIEPQKFVVPCGEKIKIDTFTYYKMLLKARVWITNSSMTRGLNFIGKNTFYLNTWHGTPIKKMGVDINNTEMALTKRMQFCDFLAQGEFEAEIFSKAMKIPKEYFHITGYPRNDELYQNNTIEYQNTIKTKFGIPCHKKVILYAPTYREYIRDVGNNVIFSVPINLDKWEKYLGDDYVLLLRMHYEVVKVLNIKSNFFVQNVSDYTNLSELMLMSDILISDYSSIIFDYSIMNKPILTYCYDYDEYAKNRGLYFDIRKELKCENISTEDILLREIKNMNISYRKEVSSLFCSKYLQAYGVASRNAVNLIYENLYK